MNGEITIVADNGAWIGKIDEFDITTEHNGPLMLWTDIEVTIDGDLFEER